MATSRVFLLTFYMVVNRNIKLSVSLKELKWAYCFVLCYKHTHGLSLLPLKIAKRQRQRSNNPAAIVLKGNILSNLSQNWKSVVVKAEAGE